MITLSEKVVDEVGEQMNVKVQEYLQKRGRQLGKRQTANVELVQVHRRLMPIADPLVVSAHDQIIRMVWSGTLPSLENLSASQAYLYQWYAVLEEVACRQGVSIPRLRAEDVSSVLSQCPRDPGQLRLCDWEVEYTQNKAFSDLIVMAVTELVDGQNEVEKEQANQFLDLVLFPLLALTRMLNEAARG